MNFELDFKLFMEMPHLAPRKHGMPTPFPLEGSYVKYVDMKFETYPENSPERKLGLFNAKFYGKLPGSHLFLVFDDISNFYATKDEPQGTHIKLREDWYEYATFLFMDGSVREPKNTREDEPNINSL